MSAHPAPSAFDSSDPDVRLAALEHARSCAECRRSLAREDPTRLFSLLAIDTPPVEALDAVSRRVAQGLPTGRPSWLDAARLSGARSRAAAAAAVLLAVGASVVALRLTPAPSPAAQVAHEPAPRAAVTGVEAGASSQVIDMTVGDVQVVMIFDPEMKL